MLLQQHSRGFIAFLMAVLFIASLSTILFELALTRIFSIILWYDYAFMAISVAFFGLGIGSLVIHMQKGRRQGEEGGSWLARRLALPEMTPSALAKKIVHYSLAYGLSVPAFIFVATLIPADPSYIYLYYLASSVPFFFAGSIMALVFFAMPRQITKLYFADLVGASAAALLLDPLMMGLGAESVLLFTSILMAGSAVAGALALRARGAPAALAGRTRISSAAVLAVLVILLVATAPAVVSAQGIMKVTPGPNKGLYWQLRNPDFERVLTQWNSFSRIDVTQQTDFARTTDMSEIRSSRELANIIIDADAGTPIYHWTGDVKDLQWMRQYMGYLPYELTETDHTLVIGSGGGQDILMALAGGSDKVTAVELNPLIVSAVRGFGASAGNVYDRPDVELHIDDGRRFISSSSEKYDVITIKLVDSWAAQLAGGYALSENYLYTVEAFQQYLSHLEDDSGMLAMIRWNFELPRLMPIVAESLERETGKSGSELAGHVIVVEDRPGLYFGRTEDSDNIYPVLVLAKTTPFSKEQLDLAKAKAEEGNAAVTVLGPQVEQPYDLLFSSDEKSASYEARMLEMGMNPKVPTDDSPFYFAREPVPRQMIILLGTVLAISAALSAMLVYHDLRARAENGERPARKGMFVLFAVFIGLGFMILEITFIQKFLLLLGTPIMALTVILFSILLSSGIGAYVSGQLFRDRPYSAVFASVPVLAGIIVLYLLFLQGIIDASITAELPARAALTFGLLFPAGLLMGFQFPSLIGMASRTSSSNNTTLLWGVNVVASIVGTVLAALLGMVIGFNGNLLVGLAMYAGAGASALAAFVSWKRAGRPVAVAE